MIHLLDSLKLRKKFVQDNSLPIKIMESPYFEYFFELYRKDFDLDLKLTNFIFANSQVDLQKKWYEIKDTIEKDVKSNPEYKELEKLIVEYPKVNFVNGSPYNLHSLDKSMVSIDIKTANYNSLKFFNKSLVKNTESYEEFISLYTDLKYFKDSKIFRQLIFEPIGAKKQAMIQKNITLQTIKELDLKNEVKLVGHDEFVLFYPKTENLLELKENVQKLVDKTSFAHLLKVESFNIVPLKNEMFYKIDHLGKKKLKKVSGQIYPQCFKKMYNLPIHEYDLLFYDSETKQIAKFLKPYFEDSND